MSYTWRQRIGFNVHTAASTPAYQDISKVKAGLALFGCTLVRNNDPGGAAKLGSGYRTITVIDTLDATTARNRVEQAIGGGTWMIECVNEPASSAAATAKATNAAIIDQVAGRVPVLASALALPNATEAAAIGPNDAYDYGSIHPYRADLNASQWANRIAGMIADEQTMAPYRPFMVTETGLWVAESNPNNYSHHPTSAVNATGQLLGNLNGFWEAGAQAVIYYELFNSPSATPPTNLFGWVMDDMTLTPHAQTLVDSFLTPYGDTDSWLPASSANVADLQAQLAAAQAATAQATAARDAALAGQVSAVTALSTAQAVIAKVKAGSDAVAAYVPA